MSELARRQQQLKSKQVAISCVVPIHNEEESLREFTETLSGQLQELTANYEIVLIDDGSSDSSVQLATELAQADRHLKLVVLARNFGKEKALTAGIDHSNGEVTVMIDADLQHPVEVIAEFLQRWSDGYDMVYGVRTNRKGESWFKSTAARGFYFLVRKISKIKIPANAGDFRLLDKKVVLALRALRERNRFMKGLYSWVGFKSIAVPFDVKPRSSGKSTMHLRHLTELALTGITAFSDVPLKVWGVIGLIVAGISFAYGCFIIVHTLLFGAKTPGFATIIVAIMFFGGVQLLSIGILGEYIARIFNEVKQRPNYLVADKVGFDEEDT